MLITGGTALAPVALLESKQPLRVGSRDWAGPAAPQESMTLCPSTACPRRLPVRSHLATTLQLVIELEVSPIFSTHQPRAWVSVYYFNEEGLPGQYTFVP